MGYLIKKLPKILDVVCVVSNSAMYEVRYKLFNEFVEYWSKQPYTRLWLVELAIGDREFEVTEAGNPRHLQLRTNFELWHKENMINLGIQMVIRAFPDATSFAWIDADVQFAHRDIVQATLQQLEIHPIVQMYSHAQDLNNKRQPTKDEWGNLVFESFAFKHQNRILEEQVRGMNPYAELGHCGYAWACTREAYDALGGLLDICIVGSGDWEMAMGLVGRVKQAHPRGISDNYTDAIWEWGRNAFAQFDGDLGVVDGLVHHYWHGCKSQRGYINRWDIVIATKFDQTTDLKRDGQGLWQLNGNKPHLRDGIRKFFRSRNEDSI